MAELSNGAFLAWEIAANEAYAAGHQYIDKELLLVGAFSLSKIVGILEKQSEEYKLQVRNESRAVESFFTSHGLDIKRIRRKIRDEYGVGNYKHQKDVIHRSDGCKRIFSRAESLAGKGETINALHIIAAIIEEPGGLIGRILEIYDIDKAAIYSTICSAAAAIETLDKTSLPSKSNKDAPSKYLDIYGVDLTNKAREGKLGPVIGREKELLNLIQTLARLKKNNPILVGEAGVGKTAIVEALAMHIACSKASESLANKRIIELNIGGLVAGTKYRGEFEEKITKIIGEASADPEVIIFIDEIHNVVGAGRGDGSIDAANIMKPALARGDFSCIGATTNKEYQRFIEPDSALERRFEKIYVDEPDREEALAILCGLRPILERHHRVRIQDDALTVAIDLSMRFDCEHRLPDKSIDLLDKAAARCRMPLLHKNSYDNIAPKASEVSENVISLVLAEKMQLPIELINGSISGNIHSRLLDMENYLNANLVGQSNAVDSVCKRIISAHSGLSNNRGPLAVFFFMGPTGVGKTELAKLITEYLFGNSNALIRFDMSEYMEEHSVSKLIGAPPGYVGYDDEGLLTGSLRSKPYSVVLLDEIEKAHPRIYDLFLQLFDEGLLTDTKGRIAKANNSIFIMTSNIEAQEERLVGFKADENDISKNTSNPTEALRGRFRPEFINRVDEVIAFRSLNIEDIRLILKPILFSITKNLQDKYKVDLCITNEAEAYILKNGFKPEYGARELYRSVEKNLQYPLSKLIAEGKLQFAQIWKVEANTKGLVFTLEDLS